MRMARLSRFGNYTENVVPHPHLPVALGFSNIKRFPMISDVQSIVVPNKYNNDFPHTFILNHLF